MQSDPLGTPFIQRRTGVLAALATLLTGCSAANVLDRLVPDDSYRGQQAVPYGPDPRHRLDVYRPVEDPTGNGYPLVVFFYGGSWTTGERATYRFVGEALARRGALVLVADYRLSPGFRYPAFLEDCALAVRWAFDHSAGLGGDPARIHLMGHSAGAYNAAMLALDARWLTAVGLSPRRLAGWIGIAGPYDFLPIGDPQVQVAFNWPGTLADTQPTHHVSAQAPRSLLLAARSDTVVNPQRSTVGLGKRLVDAGAPATVKLFDNVSHVTVLAALARPLEWLAPVLSEVLAFIGLADRGGR